MSKLLDLDTRLFFAINNLAGRSSVVDQTFIFFALWGIVVFVVLLVGYFFISRRIFWFTLLSVILSRGILTELIRLIFPRERPFVVLDGVRQLVEKSAEEPAFPSGHSAIFFAIAFAVHLSALPIGRQADKAGKAGNLAGLLFNKRIGGILIVLALFFAFTRIYTGIHFPLDIIGGALVSFASVWVIRKYLFRNKNDKSLGLTANK